MSTKCPRCKDGRMYQDTDSTVCVACGHRKWSGFKLRRPTKEDQNTLGRPTGLREKDL